MKMLRKILTLKQLY